MEIIYHPQHVDHDPGLLPQPLGGSANYYSEVARRGLIIHQAVQDAGIGPVVPPEDGGLAPLEAVHDSALVTFLRTAYARMAATQTSRDPAWSRVVIPENFAIPRPPGRISANIWAELGHYCYDTSSPIFAGTWEAAYWAAQCAWTAACRVDAGAPVAYALCRPPGHHAGPDLYGGFCYLNNAAVAAQWLVDQGRRVALVDVDYHHGNGTQAIFYHRADLFFCSIHADPADDYPFYWGYADEQGAGPGAGYTLNLPLTQGADEAVYLAALDHALAAVGNYGPDVVVVSLGFDTFLGDPVGGFRLQTGSYTRLAERFATLRTPLLLVQEGGYALDALGDNVVAFLEPLAG